MSRTTTVAYIVFIDLIEAANFNGSNKIMSLPTITFGPRFRFHNHKRIAQIKA